MEANELRTALPLINKAMREPDSFVLRLCYRDSKGNVTRRVVSPIAIDGRESMRALCLCREQVRQFKFESCSSVELVDANDVLMPVEIEEVVANG
jgi:predicted DNA-binding transcriptional regulator YafY